jgi:hypothetical protein
MTSSARIQAAAPTQAIVTRAAVPTGTLAEGRPAVVRSRHSVRSTLRSGQRVDRRAPASAARSRTRFEALAKAASAIGDAGPLRPIEISRLARLGWVIDARRWVLAVINIAAASSFVIGSVGFYRPAWYVPSVTLFLVGSCLFLLGALATALVEHGPLT